MNRVMQVLLALATVGLGACVLCTEIGCGDEFTVRLSEGHTFGAGVFTVTVSTEAEMYTCEATVNPDGSVPLDQTDCDPGMGFGAHEGVWRIRIPVTDRDPTDGTFSVRVTRAGAPVFERLEVPYHLEPYQPNGPNCPPTCMQAQIEL